MHQEQHLHYHTTLPVVHRCSHQATSCCVHRYQRVVVTLCHGAGECKHLAWLGCAVWQKRHCGLVLVQMVPGGTIWERVAAFETNAVSRW